MRTAKDSAAFQTAKALIAKLPYRIKVNRYATDGNWFTILFANEENSVSYSCQVNIGKVDCELSALENLSGRYEILIELA